MSRCRDVSVGGGSNCGGHPYISFLFRMNFFISCFLTFLNNCDGVVYMSLLENVVFCIAGIIMGCGHHKVSCIIMQHKMCTCKCKV